MHIKTAFAKIKLSKVHQNFMITVKMGKNNFHLLVESFGKNEN